MLKKLRIAETAEDLANAPMDATVIVPTATGLSVFKFVEEWEEVAGMDIPNMANSGGIVDWANIANRPASFTPAAHSQSIASVTGLQDALDGKANSAHAHAGYEPANANIQAHIASTSNPHNTTKSHVGLGNVDNTSDATTKTWIPNASYRTILDSTGSHIAGRVAGTYGMAQGNPLAISGTGTLYALNTIYIDSNDFPTVDGKAAKLRIRAQLYTNDVAPTGNLTVGLHPITRPGTSGGAGLNIFTIGAAVAGSTCVFTTPAADGLHNQVGADFSLPANGHYVIGVVTTQTVATNSHIHISASVQMRNN